MQQRVKRKDMHSGVSNYLFFIVLKMKVRIVKSRKCHIVKLPCSMYGGNSILFCHVCAKAMQEKL